MHEKWPFDCCSSKCHSCHSSNIQQNNSNIIIHQHSAVLVFPPLQLHTSNRTNRSVVMHVMNWRCGEGELGFDQTSFFGHSTKCQFSKSWHQISSHICNLVYFFFDQIVWFKSKCCQFNIDVIRSSANIYFHYSLTIWLFFD